MKTTEEIIARLQEDLVTGVQVKAEKYGEREWTTGTLGAMVEARINYASELLEWISED